MHSRRNLLIAALVVAALAAFWLWLRPSPTLVPSASVAVNKPPPKRSSAPAASTPPAVLEPASPAALPDTPGTASTNETEEVATGRMIAMHASLRAPAVADPDSLPNRRVLQIMVAKALASSSAPPPAAPVSSQ